MLVPLPVSPARGLLTGWRELVQMRVARDVVQTSRKELRAIDIHLLIVATTGPGGTSQAPTGAHTQLTVRTTAEEAPMAVLSSGRLGGIPPQPEVVAR
jgi:hypothetical protein